MSIAPLITFKAGLCDLDTASKPHKVKAEPQQGYIYMYSDDADLIHFCWRPRSQPIDDDVPVDLIMVPGDGRFVPYEPATSEQPTAKTNGRIFVLKFTSSSQRHVFWLQSKPQSSSGDASWFSPRDRKIGEIVDRLLQGDEVDVTRELVSVRNGSGGGGRDRDADDDDDETMEDVEGRGDPHGHHQSGSGGAGPDATGGDIRREGEDAREGGADGARASTGEAQDAAAVVQNFLNSLKGSSGLTQQHQQSDAQGKLYPVLNDLLETSTTLPVIEAATEEYVNNLLSFLPPTVLVLAVDDGDQSGEGRVEPSAAAVASAKASMGLGQKKALLRQVLRSPQFHQSLTSLTVALRDGGLPSIAEALGIQVENGGRVRGGSVPMGGGDAVEAFVEGFKQAAQEQHR